MSAAGTRRSFAYAQARVQARYGALPLEADWRRISGIRGLGAWLEEARGGPLRDWVKGFSAASDVQDIEAGVRKLLLGEVDAVARFVPSPWRGAIHWTRWLPLLGSLEHLHAGAEVPRWARRIPCVARLLDDDGRPQPRSIQQAGLAPLLRTESARPMDALWCEGWRACWPRVSAAVRSDLDLLAGRIGAHLIAFRRASPARAWTLRQELRERLRSDFHRLGLSPAAPFVYLALVGLDCERLRRALLDRALFPEMAAASPDSASARAAAA
jgi:hypothetical protein